MSKYGDILDAMDQDQQQQAASASVVASQFAPDQYAQAIDKSAAMGVPAAIIAKNPQAYDRPSKYGALLDAEDAPATRHWMTSVDNAAVAQDDTENLSGLERAMRLIRKGYEFNDRLSQSVDDLGTAFGSDFVKTPGMTGSGLGRLLEAGGRYTERGIRAVAGDRVADALNVQAPWWMTPSEILKRPGKVIEDAAGSIGVPEDRQNLATDIAGGVGQLGAQTLTAMLTGGASSTVSLFGQGADIMGDRAEAAGATPEQVDAAVLMGSGITTLTERYGLDKLLNRLPPQIKNGAMRQIADIAAGGGIEAAQEAVEGLLHNLTAKAIFDPDAQLFEGLERDAAAAGGAGAIARAIINAVTPGRAASFAGRDREVAEQISTAAQASKLATRSPQKLEELAAAIKAQTGTDFAYIDPTAFRTLYQSEQDAAQAAAELTGSPTTYYEAAVSGSKMAVPIEKYVARIAAKPESAKLLDFVAFTADGLTADEAKESREGFEAQAKEIAEKEVTEARPDTSQAIYDDALTQLESTGMERGTAEKNAALTQAVFRTLGRRTGMDPQQLYQRYGLKIQREGIDGGTTFDQSPVQTDTPEFQNWFGDSKVVDTEGKPTVVYHGTGQKFTKFSKSKATQGLFWVTNDKSSIEKGEAGAQGRGHVMDLYASIKNPAGWAEYHKYGIGELKRLGYDGAILPDSDGTFVAFVFEPNQLKSASRNRGTFDPNKDSILSQRFEETRRGAIQFGKDRKFTISLFDKADLSTFLHESGHLYLELVSDLASEKDAPQQVKDDFAAILKWMGVESRDQIETDQHEKWARGFEAYLREGKAPSVELQSVFARFRAWLVGVYRTLAKLNVELTDDVRRVMDRLVATDEEISAAEESQNYAPIFTNAEEAGMSPEQWAAYKDIATRAHQEATQEMTDRALRELSREQKAWWKEERAKLIDEVTAEVNQQPVYRALSFLTKGQNPDGTALPEGVEAAKLNKTALVEKYGKDFLKRLPRGTTAKDGLSAEVVGQLFGFDSGDALVEALANARPKTQLVEMTADARMRERYGDMMTDGSLAEIAMQSVHTDDRAKVMAAELKALNRKRREVKPFVKAEKDQAAREQREAREANYGNLLSKEEIKKIRDEAALQVSLNPEADANDYARAADSASKKAFTAASEGKFEDAVVHKRAEIFNREMYYEALALREDKAKQAERQKRADAIKARQANEASLPDGDQLKVIKSAADRIIQGKKVRDIQPNVYRLAEARAARKAFDFASKGKFEEAYIEKRRQILNHELYRAAVKARDEAASIVDFMRTFDRKATRERLAKAKGQYLEQIDALRERFDFSNVSNIADLRRDALSKWVAEQEAAGREVNVPEALLNEARRTPYKELMLAELQGLHDAVKNIDHLARTKDKLLKNRAAADWQDAKAELSERIEQKKGKAPPVSKFERSRMEEYGAFAQEVADSWLGPETIVEWLDDGESGPFHDYLMEPANNAEYKRETLRDQVAKPLRDLAEKVTKKRRDELHQDITIQSLGKTWDRRTLLSIVLNMGNESNMERLLTGGFRDGSEVRKFTSEALQEIAGKLNAADVKFLNTAWSTVEQLWPEVVAFQKRMGGLVPEKIQATPIQTKHGELTGGYWPAVYDSLATRAGQQQAESTDPIHMIMGANFTRASTKKGHTKGRTAVAGPLLLDYAAVMGRHTEQVITDLTHREFAIQAMKVLDDPDLRLKLQDAAGETAWHSLRGMVRGAVEQDGGYSDAANRGQKRFMRRLLSNTAVAALGFRAVTAWGNMVLAPIQAGARVNPKYILKGIGQFYRHPVNAMKFIHDASPMMAHRSKNMDHTMNVVMESLQGKRGFRAKVAEASMAMHSTADFLATHGIWLGRYREALDAGESHDEAARLADKSIRQTQTAGAPKDLSAFQRDPHNAIFKMFLGPMLIQGNRIRESIGRKGVVKNWPQAFGTLTAAWFLPAVMWDLVTGRGPDDDDDDGIMDDASLWSLRKIFFYPFMTMPFIRDAAGIAERKFSGQYAEPRMTPASDAAYLLLKAGHAALSETGDWMDGEEFQVGDVVAPTLRAAGPLFGLPTNQIDVTGSYMYDLATGEEEFENLGDLRYLAIRR